MKTENIIMYNMLENFFQLSLIIQSIIIYLILINIITFFYFGIDKTRSELFKKRISEKILWFLTAIGGSLGALGGMRFFHHKTKKSSFQAGIAIILALQIIILYFLLF